MTEPNTPPEVADIGDTINDLVNYAIVRWSSVTRSDPCRTSFVFGGRPEDVWSEYYKTKHVQAIEEARDLDPSGLAAFLLLRGGMEEYLKDYAVPALSIITDPAGVEASLADLRALRAVLEHRRVVRVVDEFVGAIRLAADHYELAGERRAGLDALLADKHRLAFVVRDAHRSMQTLEHHQFSHGEPDPGRFRYAPDVWEYWNVNSVLRAATRQRHPGVTLVLVRDPDVALASFFVICVCNGETVTLLTDRERDAHPDAKFMRRRPDRRFAERASLHWFPYDLLGVEVSEDRRSLRAAEVKALVPVDAVGARIGSLREFEPEPFVWSVLLFELIRLRYGLDNAQLPERSYTGEMMIEPHAMVGPDSAMVRSGRYLPIEARPFTGADVTHETTRPQWTRRQTGHNRWLVERYAAQVPDAALNPVGAHQLPGAAEAVQACTGLAALEEARFTMHGFRRWGPAHDPFGMDGKAKSDVSLRSMDPLAFGTRQGLERDRLWVARVNQIRVVQTLALREFDRTRGEAMAWCCEAARGRFEALMDAAARGEWRLPTWSRGENYEWRLAPSNRVRRGAVRRPTWFGFAWWPGPFEGDAGLGGRRALGERGVAHTETGNIIMAGGADRESWFDCAEPGTRANVVAVVEPNSVDALAEVLGVGVDALPWQFRHWSRYIGESASPHDRSDPEETHLVNPWSSLGLGFYVFTSRRTLNRRASTLGLQPIDWEGVIDSTKRGG